MIRKCGSINSNDIMTLNRSTRLPTEVVSLMTSPEAARSPYHDLLFKMARDGAI